MHATAHTIHINADPETVRTQIADVTLWPDMFPPTVHATSRGLDGGEELIDLWATAHGVLRTWTSRRHHSPQGITFEQVKPSPPVRSMRGEWSFKPHEGGTQVLLTHEFEPADPQDLDVICSAVDTNSTAELEALKRAVTADVEELRVDFRETLVSAKPVEEVYDFIYRSDLWPQRLPHVTQVDLTDTDGLQDMKMHVESGVIHTVRVCLPHQIVYKQLTSPRVMSAHRGQWEFEPVEDGCRYTSEHHIVLDRDAAREHFGPERSWQDIREAVAGAVRANTLRTMQAAQ
ncbi:aromatase/cyclase [Enemella evansiae]|uniref:aromatase/cyclase n=1 Tax=Enemella evansiae TaxID=2016499 RepID=UPI001595A202|nr:SRPBCC family protein [Enemella evansiae]